MPRCGWADPDWLPHGTKAMGHAAQQPIWLTTEDAEAPNGARFLVLLDGAESARLADSTACWTCSTAPTRRRSPPPPALDGGQGGRARAVLLAAGPAGLGEEGDGLIWRVVCWDCADLGARP